MEIKSWLKNIAVGWSKKRCVHSDSRTLKLAVSLERIYGINWFFECWYKFRKAKSYCNNHWVGMVKNGHSLLTHGTPKFPVFQEWIDELNCFFAFWFWYRFKKDKIVLIIIGWLWSKMGMAFLFHGTLKSAVSRMIRWIELIFACWPKFRKAKIYLNNYWVGVVKYSRDILGYRTLKSAVSQDWCDELSRFFACW